MAKSHLPCLNKKEQCGKIFVYRDNDCLIKKVGNSVKNNVDTLSFHIAICF